MKLEIARILREISDKRQFLITSHMDPDGDSLGSQMGLFRVLRDLGKEAVIINQGAIPSKYAFLNSDNSINTTPEALSFTPQVVFILECPSIDRIGFVRDIIPDSAIIVNIDHHRDNSAYANINLVDVDSCAVGETLYFVLKEGNIDITPEIASYLYAAIVSDTGGFRFQSTTARGMKVAAELIECGADPKFIADRIYTDLSPQTMRLLGETLANLKLDAGGKIGYVAVTRENLIKSGAGMENSEGFVDFTLKTSGIMMGLLFKEISESEIKVSVRSRNGFDASAFARLFDGGGHVNAAGFTLKGKLNDIMPRVISQARTFVNFND